MWRIRIINKFIIFMLLLLSTATALVVFFNFFNSKVAKAQTEDIVWDGEVSNVSDLIFYNGSAVSHDTYQGSGWAFEGLPDKWHSPGISLVNLPVWRKDISGYDEIHFYAKSNQPGTTFDFNIYGWPYFSNSVNIDPYIVGGGGLDTTYKLVKIPLSVLKTSDYPLDKIEILYFGVAKPIDDGHKIYIDNISVVKLNQQTSTTTPPVSDQNQNPSPTTPNIILGNFTINAGTVSSSAVNLSWSSVPNATKINVYVASEPSTSSSPAMNRKLITTLDGAATSYGLTGLAASADFFINIETSTPSGMMMGNIHIRTRGGPRANLDTPLRSVSAYSPNGLMLVLEDNNLVYNGSILTNNHGSAWQNGPWTITRSNGRSIPVISVYRHSLPVSQPNYQLGWGAPYDDNIVSVDHEIYLSLGENIGSQDVLRVQGPMGLDFLLPFSDRYLETPVIQLNQTSYNPRSTQRWAYVSGWLGDGGPLSLSNFPTTANILVEPSDANQPRQASITNLPVTLRSANDSDTGGEVRQIDLSSLPVSKTNRYRVQIPGVGVSWPTMVSEQAFFNIFYTVARGLFHNRWGGDLQPPYTNWSRPADHPTVYTAEGTDIESFYPETTPKTGERSLVGGYHDAGDFDQRPMHVIVPELLMRAFEINSSAFTDGQLNIPEKSNQIPDLLDEALWGVSGWEALQESDGGVRMGVETTRHPYGFYYANQDPLPYWTYARDPNHTARVAGLFAQAARLVKPYSPSRSNTLQTEAVKAYFYAMTHGASNPNLLYASSELYKLTGQLIYKATFENAWAAMGVYGVFSNLALNQFYSGDFSNNNRAMPDYVLGYLTSLNIDPNILNISRQWINNYANDAKNSVLSSIHAHRNPRPSGQDPDWGNGVTTGKYLDTIYARLQLGGLADADRQSYFNALSLSLDYILGGNPNGLVYFTGLGSRSVQEPLHLDSLAFIKDGKGPIPGIPVYGPVASLPNVPYYNAGAAGFYPLIGQHPLMRRYGDLRTFVTTNEFSVWESQAPDVEHLAVLLGLNLLSSTPPPPSPGSDTISPTVSSFDVLPHGTGGQVTVSFTVTDNGGSFLDHVELKRSLFNILNCNEVTKAGCIWSSVTSVDAPSGVSSWVSTITDSPALGTYFYGLHVVDKAGNRSVEPVPIEVTITPALPLSTPPNRPVSNINNSAAGGGSSINNTASGSAGGGGGGGGGGYFVPAAPANSAVSSGRDSGGANVETAVISPATADKIAQLKQQIAELQNKINKLLAQKEARLKIKIVNSLYLGFRGKEVEDLQTFLSEDPQIYPEGLISGYFGLLTRKAVGRFQEKYGIAKKGNAGYGIVGPKTKAKIKELIK